MYIYIIQSSKTGRKLIQSRYVISKLNVPYMIFHACSKFSLGFKILYLFLYKIISNDTVRNLA